MVLFLTTYAISLSLQWAEVVAPPAPKPDAVVAKVDGQPILASEVEAYLWQWRGAEVVQDLIEYRIISAEAKTKGVKLDMARVRSEVEGAMKDYAASRGVADPTEALLQDGFTRSRIQMRVMRQLMLEEIALKEFDPKEWVKISAITFKPDAAMTLEKCLAKASEAYKLLSKGEKWGSVIATSTTNPQVVQSEGFVGWRRMKLFPEATQAEFKTLKRAGFSKPVQTTSGVQIFRVDGKGWEAPEAEITELRNLYIQGRSGDLANELRKKAKVENYKPPVEKP
ncbi:MAG: peptidylprolyl isomerase [Armatimonadetes bacterium]|nr:peptidylprolyl isomerase [Armatimonadota bacterium]